MSSRCKADSFDDPWVAARNESGPRYLTKAPLATDRLSRFGVHVISVQATSQMLGSGQFDEKAWGRSGLTLAWVKENLSYYGGTSMREAFAEVFAQLNDPQSMKKLPEDVQEKLRDAGRRMGIIQSFAGRRMAIP